MLVYMLSDHEEDGAENVRVTTDKSKIPQMINDYYNFTPEDFDKWPEANRIKHFSDMERSRLANIDKAQSLLVDPVIDRNGAVLGSGWGGLMLHIVELE